MKAVNRKKTGQNIQKYIIQNNISYHKMAKKLGVGLSTIYKWANGDIMPDVGKFVQLSDILGVPLSELIVTKEAKSWKIEKE